MDKPRSKVKSFDISKHLIVQAWKKVEANAGAPGVDGVSIERFRSEVRDNLYKVWNRMSAGSYMPGPVRAVEIPKDHGAGVRLLGVPNVADRVAQTAVAVVLEERLEPIFHRDSYGYRPGRSALMPWRQHGGGAGGRTGWSTWTSGPSSTAFPMT